LILPIFSGMQLLLNLKLGETLTNEDLEFIFDTFNILRDIDNLNLKIGETLKNEDLEFIFDTFNILRDVDNSNLKIGETLTNEDFRIYI
jgi:hypothetical protein